MRGPNLLSTGTATMNMTPMIDVVFLLIIFFLVSSHLAKQENAIPLDLPDAVSGLDDQLERETIIVNVLADGTWQVGSTQVDQRQLERKLRLSRQASKQPLRLKIRTDKQVEYRRLEPVLKKAAAAGIGDIVFSVYEDRRP